MKLTIFVREVKFNSISFKKTEIECEGKGNKEDPIMIDSSTLTPNSFFIKNNNKQFIHFKNLDKNYISLEVCHNITIENCRLNYLEVYNSANIKINKITVSKNFKLYYSQDILIQDSNINKIKLYNTKNNIIRFCNIGKIKSKLSKHNLFEGNAVSEKQKTKFETSPIHDFIYKWKLVYQIPFAILILVGAFIIGNLLNLGIIFPTVLIIYCVIEISFITLQILVDRHKRHKIQKN